MKRARVKVCKLILLAVIDSRHYPAAGRQFQSCEFAVQGQIHDGLKYFRAGAVQFVEEKHNRLVVRREPVRWHEYGLAGLLVLVRQTDKVSRVGHLSKNKVTTFWPLAEKWSVIILDLPMPCLPDSMMLCEGGVLSKRFLSSFVLMFMDI